MLGMESVMAWVTARVCSVRGLLASTQDRFSDFSAQTQRPWWAVSRRVPGTRGWKVNNHLWDDWRFVERGSVV